jgi:hypothetical protein
MPELFICSNHADAAEFSQPINAARSIEAGNLEFVF